jgi:hypothetical protein
MRVGYQLAPFNFKVGDIVKFEDSTSSLRTGIVLGAAGQTAAVRVKERTYQIHGSDVIEVLEAPE